MSMNFTADSGRRVQMYLQGDSLSDEEPNDTTPLLQKREAKSSKISDANKPSVKKISGPDGLEAWLVVLAACFVNFVMAGLGRTTGYLYVALIERFHTDRTQASLPFFVRSSMRNLLGPVVGILGQKYGVRPVMVVGAIIGTVSAASCFYIDEIVWLTVVYGGINGVGTALTTTLPQVVISQYFKKYRSTASGMAFSGGCVGALIFPFLIEHCINTYDIGGTFLIIAGLLMHVIPAALILKKPSWWTDENGPETQAFAVSCETEQVAHVSAFHGENEDREKKVESEDDNLPQIDGCFTELQKTPTDLLVPYFCREQLFKSSVDSDFLWQNRDLVIKLLTNNFTVQYRQPEINHNNIFPSDAFIKNLELMLRTLEINGSTGDINLVNVCVPSAPLIPKDEYTEESAGSKNLHFTNGDVKSGEVDHDINMITINYIAYYLKNLFERDTSDILQSLPDEQYKNIKRILENLEELHNQLTCYGNNNSQLPNNSEFLQNDRNIILNSGDQSNTFCSHIKTAFKLYTKPLFLLVCLCRCIHFLTFISAVTIIVDYCMDKGFEYEFGKYAISAMSVGDLLGRLCFGWITDRRYVTLPKYMLSFMMLAGVATAIVPLMQSRTAILMSMATFGLLQGTIFVRHPVLLSRYLRNHEQYIAMGCINFFSGLAGFTIPSYIGFLRDSIGSYDGVFYTNGAIGAFIGFLWLFEPYCLKISSSVPSEDLPSQV